MNQAYPPQRITCHRSSMALYWWLGLHLLLLLMPMVVAHYWLALLVSPLLLLSVGLGWFKIRQYQPEFTLLPPKQLLLHQANGQYYQIEKKSFFNAGFCCLYLQDENNKCCLVVFRDSLPLADYRCVCRVVWLLC